jgi:type IV secretory pathway TrbL component
MKKIEFTNKLYYGFVLVILSYFLFINGWILIQTGKLLTLLPLTIQLTVLTLVLLRHQWTSYGIKGFSLFFIVGSGLQFLGQLMFLFADADDKINHNTIVRSLIMVLIGAVLFGFCDRSIKRRDEKIIRDIETVDD